MDSEGGHTLGCGQERTPGERELSPLIIILILASSTPLIYNEEYLLKETRPPYTLHNHSIVKPSLELTVKIHRFKDQSLINKSCQDTRDEILGLTLSSTHY